MIKNRVEYDLMKWEEVETHRPIYFTVSVSNYENNKRENDHHHLHLKIQFLLPSVSAAPCKQTAYYLWNSASSKVLRRSVFNFTAMKYSYKHGTFVFKVLLRVADSALSAC